ncbi:MAG: fluoride efflux transporter CrcB [Myxococcota bacterium]
MQQLLLVCIGGAAGSGARHLVGVWAAKSLPSPLPLSTLLVNVLGSALLGVLWALLASRGPEAAGWRALLMTGVCGGFTTYSTFNLESLQLLEAGKVGHFVLYLGATILICLVAGAIAAALARLMI